MRTKLEVVRSVRDAPQRPLNYCGKDLWNCPRSETYDLCCEAVEDIVDILKIRGFHEESEYLSTVVKLMRFHK
jgi:hypothetical protein